MPIQTPPNSFIFFDTAQVSSKILIQAKTIQSISIRITDNEDRLINTNGVNFSLSMQFDTIETPRYNLPHPNRRVKGYEYMLGYSADRLAQISLVRQENAKKQKEMIRNNAKKQKEMIRNKNFNEKNKASEKQNEI